MKENSGGGLDRVLLLMPYGLRIMTVCATVRVRSSNT